MLFLRDRDDGVFGSLGREPAPSPNAEYESRWRPGVFTLVRREHGIETTVEICVPPGATAEVTRVTVHNRTARARRLELTSYAEVSLLARDAGAGHPAFAKLFVETEFVVATTHWCSRDRRPREPADVFPLLVHTLAGPGAIEVETDRVRWIGRGRSLARPARDDRGHATLGTTGAVLDPIVSLRRAFELGPSETATFAVVLGTADSRDEAITLARRYRDVVAVGRAIEAAERERATVIERAGLDAASAETAEALAMDGHARGRRGLLRRPHGDRRGRRRSRAPHRALLGGDRRRRRSSWCAKALATRPRFLARSCSSMAWRASRRTASRRMRWTASHRSAATPAMATSRPRRRRRARHCSSTTAGAAFPRMGAST
jgi:cyclic beta-1,2-glucan synthetase